MIFSTDDWRLRAPAALLVSFYWLFGCGGESSHVDDNNLRSDVIDCEAAAARLQECCPAGVQLPDCHYSKTVYTCGWPIEYETSEQVNDTPIGSSLSELIAGSSCHDIVAGAYCNQTWPTTQPQASSQPSYAQQQEDEEEGEAHPDGPCGEWGQP